MFTKSKTTKYIIHGAKLINSKRIVMDYLGKIHSPQCTYFSMIKISILLPEYLYIK